MVLDGEIVIVKNDGLDFDALQLRLHPAASRVKLLAEQTPFLVCLLRYALPGRSGSSRRALQNPKSRDGIFAFISATANPHHTGNQRPWRSCRLVSSLLKVPGWTALCCQTLFEHLRNRTNAPCSKSNTNATATVLWRDFAGTKKGDRTLVGSLLLGLFDYAGALQHVGVCASFTAEKRRELAEFLEPYRKNALADHPWKGWAGAETASADAGQRMPGGKSRWSQGKDLSWEPLRPELVVEVAYEHMQGSRFRHMAHFRRWRSDEKAPAIAPMPSSK